MGYLGGNPIAGWEVTGGYGLNGDGLGPFTDNGLAEAGESVLFVQGSGAVSQLIEGLTPGATYTVSYKINRRACCSEDIQSYELLIDDEIVFDEELEIAGAGSPFWERTFDFSPATDSARIGWNNLPSGDQSMLIDDIRVFLKDGPVGTEFDVPLDISIIAGNTARLAWPKDAPDAVLQFSSDLQNWTLVEAPPLRGRRLHRGRGRHHRRNPLLPPARGLIDPSALLLDPIQIPRNGGLADGDHGKNCEYG